MTMTPTQALRAYCDAFAAGDVAAIADLFAPDAVVDLPLVGARMTGHAEVMHEVESAVRGLKDIRVVSVDADLFPHFDNHALSVDQVGAALDTHRLLAIHVLLSPSSELFRDLMLDIAQ